jgi:hypothetical protein
MTTQSADNVIIKDVKYFLYPTPLDKYWNRKNPKPEIGLTKSSCWRGYIATWEISDKSLYLIDIVFHSPEEDVGMDYLFPNNSGKIKADWYTGELRIPFGKNLYFVSDYGPVYESDLFLKVKKGNVINHRYKANFLTR